MCEHEDNQSIGGGERQTSPVTVRMVYAVHLEVEDEDEYES